MHSYACTHTYTQTLTHVKSQMLHKTFCLFTMWSSQPLRKLRNSRLFADISNQRSHVLILINERKSALNTTSVRGTLHHPVLVFVRNSELLLWFSGRKGAEKEPLYLNLYQIFDGQKIWNLVQVTYWIFDSKFLLMSNWI